MIGKSDKTRIQKKSVVKNDDKKKSKINKPVKNNIQIDFIKIKSKSKAKGDSSILSHRNSACSMPKVCSINPEFQKTDRLKSSKKKLMSSRKIPHTKQKINLLEDFIQNKVNLKQTTNTKRSKSAYNTPFHSNAKDESGKKVINIQDLAKMKSFLNDKTDRIVEIKKQSDSFLLQQMNQTQNTLMTKLQALEKSNFNQISQNNLKFEQLRNTHKRQIQQCREQIQYLNCKVQQQKNKNTVLSTKISNYKSQAQQLTIKMLQKQDRLQKLSKQKLNLQRTEHLDRLKDVQGVNINREVYLQNIKKQNKQLQQKLAKCEAQKIFIKKNSIEVLQLIQQQFGNQLKFNII